MRNDFSNMEEENKNSAVPSVSDRKPPKKWRKPVRGIELALFAISLALVVLLAMLIGTLSLVGASLSSLFVSQGHNNSPPKNSFSVVNVIGTIQNAEGGALGMNEPSYQHSATVKYINSLIENENDKGILLYMNTGGGGVYESDEVYRALEDYKEKTGRPVWAYMAANCASGGYYICMAAQHITANYNTTTGSIGVYISFSDTSALYEKLGIETVLVRSGANKGVGVKGVEITEENRAVYQNIVDIHYERFVELVAKGRGLPDSKVRPFADGRPFLANQALENGLVDKLGDWESAKTAFEEHTGAEPFWPNFSQKSPIAGVLGSGLTLAPKGETQVLLDLAESLAQGVPMMYAPGLW